MLAWRREHGEHVVEAGLVVGADGRGSTVGRLAGARTYNVMPHARFTYWGYFERARWTSPATVSFLRWGEELVIACPADAGLYMVIAIPPLHRLESFVSDL